MGVFLTQSRHVLEIWKKVTSGGISACTPLAPTLAPTSGFHVQKESIPDIIALRMN
jgi:hypothetical protein